MLYFFKLFFAIGCAGLGITGAFFIYKAENIGKSILAGLGIWISYFSFHIAGAISGAGHHTIEAMLVTGKDYAVLSQIEQGGERYVVVKRVDDDSAPMLVLITRPLSADVKIMRFNEALPTAVVEKK